GPRSRIKRWTQEPSMISPLRLTVPAPGGERLDRFLAAAQTDLSRSRLQSLIRDGLVSVNSRPARASHRLRGGDAIEVVLPALPASHALEPEPLTAGIVFEDE